MAGPAYASTPRRPLRTWLVGALVALVGGILAAWLWALPPRPDVFYDTDVVPTTQPGMLLRSEPFTQGLPAGARGWRILYATTRAEGKPALGSAIVLVGEEEIGKPRNVIAWTHGTVGASNGCAPSLSEEPFANVPALTEALALGWAVVAPDYTGLGTPGQHPYLIGEGQARSSLDAIRALRQMPEVLVDDRTVVWGHSQGGHAALWTGILAPTYASDVALDGVAAIAPASDLPALVDAAQDTPIGRIMSAYILRAYDAEYPDIDFDAETRPGARWLAYDMASRCLAGSQALFSVGEAMLVPGPIFARPPTTGALGRRLQENVPNGPIGFPLLIAQGESDALVLPEVQARFVARRCREGQPIHYRRYPGEDHLSIVAPDSPLTPHLVAWTRARFVDLPDSGNCPG